MTSMTRESALTKRLGYSLVQLAPVGLDLQKGVAKRQLLMLHGSYPALSCAPSRAIEHPGGPGVCQEAEEMQISKALFAVDARQSIFPVTLARAAKSRMANLAEQRPTKPEMWPRHGNVNSKSRESTQATVVAGLT